eukprot:SAG31_NODE_40987_length_278_cov_0.592179_1_plen_27_part_10
MRSIDNPMRENATLVGEERKYVLQDIP